MTSRVITCETDRKSLVSLISAKKLPFNITVADGRKRSIAQNKLQRLWMNEIAEQLGEYTPEYYRGWCKAWFGIPILCAESDEYAEVYKRIIAPLDYDKKIEMMQRPIDYPITRHMTVEQKKEYLDAVFHHFSDRGVELTQPGEF